MKKIFLSSLLLICLINLSSVSVYAAEGLIKPNSKLYFLQSWGESVRLFFILPKEQKINYLLKLTEKRIDEIKDTPSTEVINRYKDHFRQLDKLSTQVSDNKQIIEKIKEVNINQQQVLSKVYNQVPQQAKEAIINAQENSSKHIINLVKVIEGSPKAQKFAQQINQIQQLNSTKPGSENKSGGGGEQIQPVQPIPINQPVEQN